MEKDNGNWWTCCCHFVMCHLNTCSRCYIYQVIWRNMDSRKAVKFGLQKYKIISYVWKWIMKNYTYKLLIFYPSVLSLYCGLCSNNISDMRFWVIRKCKVKYVCLILHDKSIIVSFTLWIQSRRKMHSNEIMNTQLLKNKTCVMYQYLILTHIIVLQIKYEHENSCNAGVNVIAIF